MRILFASAAFVFLPFTPSAASQTSWPITPTVEYSTAETDAAGGATANVRIDVHDAASAVEVEVYGLDGTRVGDRNMVRVRRIQMAAGASLAFNIAIHPGHGQSFVVVSARAHFAHAGDGGTVRSFPFGHEDGAQQAEHSRCLRQDPDGVWMIPIARRPPDDLRAPQIGANAAADWRRSSRAGASARSAAEIGRRHSASLRSLRDPTPLTRLRCRRRPSHPSPWRAAQ